MRNKRCDWKQKFALIIMNTFYRKGYRETFCTHWHELFTQKGSNMSRMNLTDDTHVPHSKMTANAALGFLFTPSVPNGIGTVVVIWPCVCFFLFCNFTSQFLLQRIPPRRHICHSSLWMFLLISPEI